MEHIVMTLLVRREPGDSAGCAYAVQMTFPKELSPGEMVSLTSARLITREETGRPHRRRLTPIARRNGARLISRSRPSMRPGSMATRGPGTASCAASAGASTTFPVGRPGHEQRTSVGRNGKPGKGVESRAEDAPAMQGRAGGRVGDALCKRNGDITRRPGR